jgi:hypothetical protein
MDVNVFTTVMCKSFFYQDRESIGGHKDLTYLITHTANRTLRPIFRTGAVAVKSKWVLLAGAKKTACAVAQKLVILLLIKPSL